MFDGFGNENDMPEWLKKCMTCTHVYTTKEDEVNCRCRKGCNYKPYNPVKKQKKKALRKE